MSITQIPEWMVNLDEDDLAFIKKFILNSGSLKETANLYGVTYPTVRLRLDRLIQKINLSDKSPDEPFIQTIRKLAIDEKIDLEIARFLVGEYKKNQKEGRQ